MGGCRCTFRSCTVSTLTYPGMHFFHYPIKNEERLDEWIKYSKYTALHTISKSQARNKVVCALHFRDECFMNYKKDRLTPTAVPTLDRLRNGLVLDYEQSSDPTPTELPPTTEKHLIPPKGYQQLGLADDFFTQRVTHIELLQHKSPEEPPEKRKKTQHYPSKILNKGLVSTIDLVDDEPDVTPYERFEDDSVGYTLYEAVVPSEPRTEVVNEVDIINLSEIEFLPDKGEEEGAAANVEEEEEAPSITQLAYEQALEAFDSEMHNLKQECDDKIREAEDKAARLEAELVEAKEKVRLLMESAEGHKTLERKAKKQIEELKTANSALMNAAAAAATTTVTTKPKPSGTQLTKPQLFNGIKKYLSASMSALVRMEMFGGSERQWKPDEKEVSMELLRLGEKVYDYFSDEWRFRLPPKKLVADWMNQGGHDEDEEDL